MRGQGVRPIEIAKMRGMKRLAAELLLPLAIAAVAITVKALGLAPLESITLGSVDLFQRMAPRPAPEAPVLVIDIDEESLRTLGQWPWPRTVLADLTDKLTDAGAAACQHSAIGGGGAWHWQHQRGFGLGRSGPPHADGRTRRRLALSDVSRRGSACRHRSQELPLSRLGRER